MNTFPKQQMERGKLKRVHHVSNISTALKFLEMKKIKLVNINVSDIADGKPSIVLGLIWTIILYFQIEDTFAQQEHDPLSALEKFRMNAKKALAWTENAITKKYGIKISDVGKSWRDGLAFNAIVHTIRPDLIDFENVRNQSARANLEQAFSTAEDHLGIARLLDPEDVDVEKPDEMSIMTHVAQFLKAYPEAGEDPALGRRSKDPATQEMNDYTDLMTWLSAEAEEVLQIVDQPVTDRQQEYMIRSYLNADTREEKMTVEKQEVYLSNRRFCHGTKLLTSSLSLAPFFVPCAGGTGHGSSQPEHQGHSEIYPSTLNVVSNCPSRGEYMQTSLTKCAEVCGSYMQDGNCAYHCMRDSSKTKLVEFCAKPKPFFDYCPEYDPVDQTIQKDFATLCNSTSTRNYYDSSDIYFCDPNNCLQLHESSVRNGATTLTTLMNETTEMNDGDSQEWFLPLFIVLAALLAVIIMGYILFRVFGKRGIFSEMRKKRNQNGKQYVYTRKRIPDYV